MSVSFTYTPSSTMSVPFTYTPSSITVFIDGRMRTVAKTHANFSAVKDALLNLQHGDNAKHTAALDQLRELIDIPTFIAKFSEGRIQVAANEVRFDGEPLHNYATERLLALLRAGFDVRPLARFLDRLARNEYGGDRVRVELYRFLERGDMPITEDGCFLAFKRVHADYTSINTGPGGAVTRNDPGTRVEFPRERLKLEERGQTCSSSGLHVCSYGYLPHFHPGDGNKVVTVKCAPEDVWSVPHGEDAKCQMVGYWVLDVIPDDEVKHLFDGVKVTDDAGHAYSHDEAEEEDEAAEELRDDDAEEEDDAIWPRREDLTAPAATVKDSLQRKLRAQNQSFKKAHGHSLSKVRKLVIKHGQREASRRTGIPRATLQRWLAKE